MGHLSSGLGARRVLATTALPIKLDVLFLLPHVATAALPSTTTHSNNKIQSKHKMKGLENRCFHWGQQFENGFHCASVTLCVGFESFHAGTVCFSVSFPFPC
jgi:hypothetical protein